MVKTRKELRVDKEYNLAGEEKMYLTDLSDFPGKNPKLNMFSEVRLKVGQGVGFHVHEGEFESYFIISGKGMYLDHDKYVEVEAGCVTHTPSGKGHSIRNIGDEELVFIALIVAD